MQSLLGLERVGGLSLALDPDGLMLVEVSTEAAVFRAYIQTLKSGRDTRSRKLLRRVRATSTATKFESDTAAIAA